MAAKEKYVIIGLGYPRKRMAWTNTPWYSGTMKTKSTAELLKKLHENKYQHASWLLLPNKKWKKGSKAEPPYFLNIAYWGTDEEVKK
ncbi:hypothetical protein L0244_06260 [bacterium]|nr:hypothetical protein [bacterium]